MIYLLPSFSPSEIQTFYICVSLFQTDATTHFIGACIKDFHLIKMSIRQKTYRKNWKKVYSLITELALLKFLQECSSVQLQLFFLGALNTANIN